MREYVYDGPVMCFDVCVKQRWRASTYAASEAKAKNNLTYRYKKDNGLMPYTKISLPGKIVSA